MLKHTGDPVKVTIAVQHKGAAINGRAVFFIGAGNPDVPVPTPGVLFFPVNKVPVSFQEDSDWRTYTFEVSGVYPALTYENGYNKADAVIGILNQAEDQTLAGGRYYDDVYGWEPGPPQGGSPVLPVVIVGGAAAVITAIIAAVRSRKRKK